MYNGKKIVVVMPAYNAEKTLVRTCEEIDRSLVDEIVLVDDSGVSEGVQYSKRLQVNSLY